MTISRGKLNLASVRFLIDLISNLIFISFIYSWKLDLIFTKFNLEFELINQTFF